MKSMMFLLSWTVTQQGAGTRLRVPSGTPIRRREPPRNHRARGVRGWGCISSPGRAGAPHPGSGTRRLQVSPMGILDMIGPVMIGPSSRHTAGACRLGLLARAILDSRPEKATITLQGSFAKTGRGHGTARALVAGLLGMRPDDGRLHDALAEEEKAGLQISWSEANLGNVHPNSVHLALDGSGRHTT